MYTFPTAQIKKNIKKSASMYDGGIYSFSNWTNGKIYTLISNYTDTIMLNTAVFRPTESAVMNALITAHAKYPEADNSENMLRIANDEDGCTIQEYPRYWHGYLLYMIPALHIMDVGDLKVIGMILQFFLTIMLVYLLGKKSTLLMLLYGIVAAFINPVTTVLTFQEADIYCIMMVSMIIILLYNEKLKRGWYVTFFIINGICVAYFDFLTYPLVAFGVPLILVLLLNESVSINDVIKKITMYSLFWGIGYVGMWGGKWIAASVFTGRNVFADAFGAIKFRTHGQYNNMVTYGSTLETIWDSINDIPMLVLLLITITICIFYLIKNRFRVSIDRIGIINSIGFLIISLFPFVWFFVVMNHSVIHPHLSYRELSITIWALAAIFFTVLKPKIEQNNINE